jgi:acetolactate synthase-1/2/3 large subunit
MTTMRVADYLARTLVARGISDLFLVTGGGAMHLNDAFGHCPGLRYWPCHHEQACAMAAEGYYRAGRRMAAVNVTTGPGGTNAITGVYGAYVDSIPMLVVSGQVKWETCVRSTGLPLRQLGDQEVDIVRMVAPVTKYAVLVSDPASIRYHLERALHLATQGRPGPVWLDIPGNVQGAQVDPELLAGYDPAEDADLLPAAALAGSGAAAVLAALRTAERPVVLGGSGLWAAGAEAAFRELAERLEVPFVTAFNGHDLLPSDHPRLVGRQGTIGDRAGNYAVQNADFLLILGSRMNIRQVGYAWERFAPAARIAMVDIDAAELAKPTLRLALPVHAELGAFMGHLLAGLEGWTTKAKHRAYLAWCRGLRQRYPVLQPAYLDNEQPVNPYVFMDRLFAALPAGQVVITGDGTACITAFQAGRIKPGQRLFSNSGSAPMGFDLPAAIGAAVATGRQVVCLAGDGSIMMNLQELQTIAHHRLPVKIFLLNNGGYHSIRQTQHAYFPGAEVGIGPGSGVGFPDFALLAQAHGLGYRCIGDHAGLAAGIAACLEAPGPQLCELLLDPTQPFAPRVASRRLPDGRMVSAGLEDMAPFLPAAEQQENCLYLNLSSPS